MHSQSPMQNEAFMGSKYRGDGGKGGEGRGGEGDTREIAVSRGDEVMWTRTRSDP